jgi:hypothetical protein
VLRAGSPSEAYVRVGEGKQSRWLTYPRKILIPAQSGLPLPSGREIGELNQPNGQNFGATYGLRHRELDASGSGLGTGAGVAEELSFLAGSQESWGLQN